jgi:lipoprotein-releasing system ATP-binding protein
MHDLIVEFKNISKILYDEHPAVTLIKDVNLDIKAGEFAAILGPSGSGKSSLLYLLGLLDTPSSGIFKFLGKEVQNASQAEKQKIRLEHIGFIFQFHYLLPEFSSYDNIALPIKRLGKLSDKERDKKVNTLLDDLDIMPCKDKLPSQMSGGEKQRVAIARALANDPSLILADEPTGSLDSKNGENVFTIFKNLAKVRNQTIICITHDEHLASFARRKIHLKDGEVVGKTK